jgi:hypothetical protein
MIDSISKRRGTDEAGGLERWRAGLLTKLPFEEVLEGREKTPGGRQACSPTGGLILPSVFSFPCFSAFFSVTNQKLIH